MMFLWLIFPHFFTFSFYKKYVINIILILNPKQNHIPATKEKINSVP